jgi:hypothetical protein
MTEFGGNEENHVKAGPVRDNRKYRTLHALSVEASPNCIRYRLMCSTVLVSSNPENLIKSVGTLTLGGRATLLYHSGYRDLYVCV